MRNKFIDIVRFLKKTFTSSSKLILSSTLSQEFDRATMNREENRLATLGEWPHRHIEQSELALYGFFYVGTPAFSPDRVECFFCKVMIESWEENDTVFEQHLRWSPHCRLITDEQTDNIPINPIEFNRMLLQNLHQVDTLRRANQHLISYDVWGNGSELNELYQYKLSNPRYLEYCLLTVRQKSFERWPLQIKQTPTEMSEAGFFYTDIGDEVNCFCCGTFCSKWKEFDDPWERHAMVNSKCAYVKLIKQNAFILKMIEKQSLEQQRQEHFSNSVDTSDTVLLANTSEMFTCNICSNHITDALFMPCKHLYSCVYCASCLQKCPICNLKYDKIERIFSFF